MASKNPGGPEHGARKRRSAKEPSAPSCAMSIHAHPDDQEFTVGGTLAKWARAGSRIVTVCITSGGAGSNEWTPPDATREGLATLREEEQRRACRVLGVAEVVFLGYEDGVLEPSIALRRDLTRLIRRYQPEAVICGDPTVRFYGKSYLNHPDHRAAGDSWTSPARWTRSWRRCVSTRARWATGIRARCSEPGPASRGSRAGWRRPRPID